MPSSDTVLIADWDPATAEQALSHEWLHDAGPSTRCAACSLSRHQLCDSLFELGEVWMQPKGDAAKALEPEDNAVVVAALLRKLHEATSSGDEWREDEDIFRRVFAASAHVPVWKPIPPAVLGGVSMTRVGRRRRKEEAATRCVQVAVRRWRATQRRRELLMIRDVAASTIQQHVRRRYRDNKTSLSTLPASAPAPPSPSAATDSFEAAAVVNMQLRSRGGHARRHKTAQQVRQPPFDSLHDEHHGADESWDVRHLVDSSRAVRSRCSVSLWPSPRCSVSPWPEGIAEGVIAVGGTAEGGTVALPPASEASTNVVMEDLHRPLSHPCSSSAPVLTYTAAPPSASSMPPGSWLQAITEVEVPSAPRTFVTSGLMQAGSSIHAVSSLRRKNERDIVTSQRPGSRSFLSALSYSVSDLPPVPPAEWQHTGALIPKDGPRPGGAERVPLRSYSEMLRSNQRPNSAIASGPRHLAFITTATTRHQEHAAAMHAQETDTASVGGSVGDRQPECQQRPASTLSSCTMIGSSSSHPLRASSAQARSGPMAVVPAWRPGEKKPHTPADVSFNLRAASPTKMSSLADRDANPSPRPCAQLHNRHQTQSQLTSHQPLSHPQQLYQAQPQPQLQAQAQPYQALQPQSQQPQVQLHPHPHTQQPLVLQAHQTLPPPEDEAELAREQLEANQHAIRSMERSRGKPSHWVTPAGRARQQHERRACQQHGLLASNPHLTPSLWQTSHWMQGACSLAGSLGTCSQEGPVRATLPCASL